MANKSNGKKNYLNYILIGLVAVSMLLLITQIISDTGAALNTEQAQEDYAVFMAVDGAVESTVDETTPTPLPQEPIESDPEPTAPALDPYIDNG